MLPVLDLDPELLPPVSVRLIAVLGDKALKPHPAGCPE
jgi:hypothetical protein